MKRIWLVLLAFSCLIGTVSAQEHLRYALIWHDEFNSGALDEQVWSKIRRSKSDWAIHMSPHDTLYAFDKGDLVLRGMVNDFLPNDNAAFLTGGVWSKYRKTFGFGRVEVRAKFDVAQGFWPAIWMLPQVNHDLSWPHGGEIDIMEHFRDNPTVNQTVHSDYTVNLGQRNRPSHVAYPKYNEGEYNTYSMERFQDSLVFFVNGKRTLNYPRFRDGDNGQFPFSQHDYYLILDAQIGRDRSPYIDTTKMPVELRIDYVRYYELDTKTDVIPEPKEFQVIKAKKKKLRRVVYDVETHFDNPDEYRIVVKCGKAIIAGNRQWAESTLAQLVDENGRIANLEVHDWATCPCRGIAMETKNLRLSFDEMVEFLDLMAFYKLNYLQWDDEPAYNKEECDRLRKHAIDLGITVTSGGADRPALDDLEAEGQTPADFSNRVFLQQAATNGGVLALEQVDEATMEVMMAFSERYWRGGNAGEGTAENGLLSPAGSRLANFKEKVAAHRGRFDRNGCFSSQR